MSNYSLPPSRKYSSIRVNTVIKLYTLILLYNGPKHGYEVMKHLEKMLGTSIGPSQVYPFLHRLRRAGLLEVSKVGPRDKRVYALTQEGREFVRELLRRSLELIKAAVDALGPEEVCPPEYIREICEKICNCEC